MLGTQTRGGRMVGADKSTELQGFSFFTCILKTLFFVLMFLRSLSKGIILRLIDQAKIN